MLGQPQAGQPAQPPHLGRRHRGHGAAELALAVTEANAPARALYAGLGFAPVGRYAYWQRDG